MPRSKFYEQLVQWAIAAGLPGSNENGRAEATRLHELQATEQDQHQLMHTSTPRPLWLKARKSSFVITEPVGGFRPADLVLPFPPPLEDPGAAECRPPPDARWEGGAAIDLSKFQHYNNPERFDRQLRRLHELVGTRKFITAGEQFRNPTRTRQMGQMYVSNLFGLYEVEHWSDANGRRGQVEWSQWILDVLHADRRDKTLPRCPLGARKVLKHAIADVLCETEPKKKRRYQRMLEGTRLETGILQAVGLKVVGRSCCVRKVTTTGEGASFAEEKLNDPPAVSHVDVLDRLGSFLKRRRIGQAFDDAEVIATAMRRKKTPWGRLRRYSGLEFPKLELVDFFQKKLDMVLKRWSGQQYAPAQPSKLRQWIVLPSSFSSRDGRDMAPPRKAKPCSIPAILRKWFGPDVALATRRARMPTHDCVISELRKLTAEAANGGRPAQANKPRTNAAALQSAGVPVDSQSQIAPDGPRGTKRPLSEAELRPGSAQEGIKRVRIRDEKRRSSTLLSSSPLAGSAEEGIVAAQAENKQRRSSSLFSSSPSTGEPPDSRSDNQLEEVHAVLAQEAAQNIRWVQPTGQPHLQRLPMTKTQQPILQQRQNLAGASTQLRPPGRQYRPQARYMKRLLGQQPHAPLGPAMAPQASQQPPASVRQQVPRRISPQAQAQTHARASTNPSPRQSVIPQLAARAREDYWRRILMVPDAAQLLDQQTAAHGQAAWAEVNRQYQLILQSLTSLPAFQNATAQQIDAATQAHLSAQFRMAEAQWKVSFPTLALPQDQPLARQLYALKWILSTVNPPQRDWPEFQAYHTACCELEARVEQLSVLRSWTRQWEQTLADARAHSAHIGR